jgi:hypothetical protein
MGWGNAGNNRMRAQATLKATMAGKRGKVRVGQGATPRCGRITFLSKDLVMI